MEERLGLKDDASDIFGREEKLLTFSSEVAPLVFR